MGEVYRAYDEQLARNVALKVLPSEQLGDATARARLLREARSAAALNHPHICTIYEVSETGQQAYIAMELIDGKTLSDQIEAGPLAPSDVVRYGFQLADALAHAHDRGIVHHDLKSGNVMITADGRLKVLDFGLAKKIGSGADIDARTEVRTATLTQPGTVIGTLAYMAPEQLRGNRGDMRSDIWALGVILFEMITGDRPFRGKTHFELVSSIMNEQPNLNLKMPASLRSVIGRCLSKDPASRFQHASEIKAVLESSGTAARMPAWIPAAIAAAIVVATTSVYLVRRPLPPAPKTSGIHSLAVLPLENLSGDANQEYFADGMTEALIADLGRIRGLSRVIARSTVMQFKGSKKSPAEIARQLDVDALMTGSVVRAGNRVRVTAELVNPSTGAELWSGRYERDLRDVLALQNDLTRAIVLEISGALTPEQKQLFAKARTVNPVAYEDYLKGRYYRWRINPQDLATARIYFERALKEDPDFGAARIGLADSMASTAHAGWTPSAEMFPQIWPLITQTLASEPDLAEAHDLMAGYLFVWNWDWPGAELEFKRAIELNPNYPDAHVRYSQLLQLLGRSEESIAEARRAVALDPQNQFFRGQLGYRLAGAGKYDEAIAELRKAGNHVALCDVFFLQHRYDDSWREAQAGFSRKEVKDAALRGYASGGYSAAMKSAAEEIIATRSYHFAGALSVARLYVLAGMPEKVFEWLQKAASERDSRMCYVTADPIYAEIRRDPRFAQIIATVRAKAAAASR